MKWFVDLEFTNLDPVYADALVMAIVITDDECSIVESVEHRYAATMLKHWSEDAEAVHGISYMRASFEKPQELICEDIKDLANKYPCDEFICHALTHSFFDFKNKTRSYAYIDYAVIENAFKKHGNVYEWYKICSPDKRISTVKLAKEAGHTKRRLDVLCEYYGVKLDHHNAMSDALACREIYLKVSGNKISVNTNQCELF